MEGLDLDSKTPNNYRSPNNFCLIYYMHAWWCHVSIAPRVCMCMWCHVSTPKLGFNSFCTSPQYEQQGATYKYMHMHALSKKISKSCTNLLMLCKLRSRTTRAGVGCFLMCPCASPQCCILWYLSRGRVIIENLHVALGWYTVYVSDDASWCKSYGN